jgi:AAA15 family ATPase/GTPase
MAKIDSLMIDSFRGIKDLYLENLNNVNLIVGPNNSGKTSLLEAIELLRISNDNLYNAYKVARSRENTIFKANSPYETIMNIFPKNDHIKKIELSGICDGKEFVYRFSGKEEKVLSDFIGDSPYSRNRVVHMNEEIDGFNGAIMLTYGNYDRRQIVSFNRYSGISGTAIREKKGFSIEYVSAFAHIQGNTIREIVRNEGYKKICVEVLKQFDKKIEDIKTLPGDISNQVVECLYHKELGNMPLSTFGDGVKRALVLANSIAKANGGILLIDEIETSIHEQLYDDIFRFVLKACALYNIQLFITTHSIETVDSLLKTQDYDSQTDFDNINVITLKKVGDKTLSRNLNGRRVSENRESFNFEVRL